MVAKVFSLKEINYFSDVATIVVLDIIRHTSFELRGPTGIGLFMPE